MFTDATVSPQSKFAQQTNITTRRLHDTIIICRSVPTFQDVLVFGDNKKNNNLYLALLLHICWHCTQHYQIFQGLSNALSCLNITIYYIFFCYNLQIKFYKICFTQFTFEINFANICWPYAAHCCTHALTLAKLYQGS